MATPPAAIIVRQTAQTTQEHFSGEEKIQYTTIKALSPAQLWHKFYLKEKGKLREKQKQKQTQARAPLNEDPHPPTYEEVTHQRNLFSQVIPGDNNGFGDALPHKCAQETFRCYFQNVNTLSASESHLEMKGAAAYFQQRGVGAFGFQETNLAWNRARRAQVTGILRRTFQQAMLSTSSSVEPSISAHQPGGTATGLVGKWTGRMLSFEEDGSGLGRWSCIGLQGRNGRKIYIYTAYRVCQTHSSAAGIFSAYAQQQRLLSQQQSQNPSNKEPNLRLIMLQALQKEILQRKRTEGAEIILSMDANEQVGAKPTPLTDFVRACGLIDLISSRHGVDTPRTYNRGSKCIDYVWGTTSMREAVSASSILAFNTGYIHSDHRAIMIDFDSRLLFGSTIRELLARRPRGIYSNQPQKVREYAKEVIKQCREKDLYRRSSQLYQKAEESVIKSQDLAELEVLDSEFTAILLNAEKKIRRFRLSPWTPMLHELFLVNLYWKFKLTAIRTNTCPPEMAEIEQKLECKETDLWQGDKGRKIYAQIRKSKTALQNYRKEADFHRLQYLSTEIEAAELADDTIRKQRLARMKNAESRARCYARIQSYTKPNRSGGINYVDVLQDPLADPNDQSSQWNRIHDPAELERALLQHAKGHFAQAEGTPFTVEPLRSLLGYDGCTDFAKEVAAGTADIDALDIDPYAKLLLKHMKGSTTSPINVEPSADDLFSCYRNWREKTATSPSGRHLGLYRALLKDDNTAPTGKAPSNAAEESVSDDKQDLTSPDEYLNCGTDAMMVHYHITAVAMKAAYPLERWTTMWNLLLQKDPKSARIDKNRCIMIMEADRNFTLKFTTARKLMWHAETQGTVADEQIGARAGHCAIDGALLKTILYDIIRMTRSPAGNLEMDAAANFDRILENQSNMSLRAHGMPEAPLLLHARTQARMKYHIVTKHGVSKAHNVHTTNWPWHGMGQGAGDAPSRWVLVSSDAIRAYNSTANRWTVVNPDNTREAKAGLQAFIDDVNSALGLAPDATPADLAKALQHNADVWNGLINATGGKLNVNKCSMTIFRWYFNDGGVPALYPPHECGTEVTLLDYETNRRTPLRICDFDEATRLLGVHMAMSGTTNPEEKVLRKKCELHGRIVHACQMNTTDTYTHYSTCFIPSVCYSLPASHITEQSLNQIQKHVQATFLAGLGVNRNFPRAVVYAPVERAGVGLLNLYTEQGIGQVRAFIRHVRSASTLGQVYRIAIDHYQLTAGLSRPVLQDTRWLYHTEGLWIDSMREFLHQTQAEIILQQAWVIQPLRQNDRHIMDDVVTLELSSNETCAFNRVRLYLQVTTVAEICDHTGSTILRHLVNPLHKAKPLPDLAAYSSSTLAWPKQPFPGTAPWNVWCAIIRKLYLRSDGYDLPNPLGKWNTNWTTFPRTWKYRIAQPGETITYTQTDGTKALAALCYTNRIKSLYSSHSSDAITPAESYTQAINLPILPIAPFLRQSTAIPQTCKINHPLPALQLDFPVAPATSIWDWKGTPGRWNNFLSALPAWERELIRHPQYQLKGYSQLIAALQTDSTNLFIISGSFYDTVGAYAWQISTSENILVHGHGTMAISPQYGTRQRNETSGVLAALRFLIRFMEYSRIRNIQCPKSVQFSTDKGLVKAIRRLAHLPTLHATETLQNDFDLRQRIVMSAKALPFPHEFQYQARSSKATAGGEDTEDPTSWLRECRSQAKEFNRELTHRNTQEPNTCRFLQANLRIQGRVVPNDYAQHLRTAHNSKTLEKYLCEKFKWKPKVYASLDWIPTGKAMITLIANDRKRITKFVHELLPLKKFLHTQYPNVHCKKCPTCKNTTEDSYHFLACRHESRSKHWDALEIELGSLQTKTKADDNLQILLLNGLLRFWRKDRSPPIEPRDPELHNVYHQQKSIGWQQLLYGRFSQDWATTYEKLYVRNHKKTSPSGQTWVTQVIRTTWRFILSMWTARCDDEHGRTPEEINTATRRRLYAQVRALFRTAETLSVAARTQWVKTPLKDLLLKSNRYLEKWVALAGPAIRHEMKGQKTRDELQTNDVRDYFMTNPPHTAPRRDNSTLRPP